DSERILSHGGHWHFEMSREFNVVKSGDRYRVGDGQIEQFHRSYGDNGGIVIDSENRRRARLGIVDITFDLLKFRTFGIERCPVHVTGSNLVSWWADKPGGRWSHTRFLQNILISAIALLYREDVRLMVCQENHLLVSQLHKMLHERSRTSIVVAGDII